MSYGSSGGQNLGSRVNLVVIKGKTVLKAGTEVRKGKRRWEERTADSSHMAQGLLVNLLDKRESRKCGSQAVFVVASEEWFIPLSKTGGEKLGMPRASEERLSSRSRIRRTGC